MLSNTLLWSPPIADPSPAWTTGPANYEDWVNESTGLRSYWQNGYAAEFPGPLTGGPASARF